MNDELEQAINSFRNGNEEAFSIIYELLYNKVFFIAKQHAKNDQEAEDILQESFISIYQSLPTLDNIEYFNAWLNRVVYSYFLKSIRSKQISMRVDMGENYKFDAFLPDDSSKTPDELYYEGELKGQIEIAMEQLSMEQKDVARLRFYDEMSIKEIAYVLEVPEGTVKSRINTVRKLISPLLQNQRNLLQVSTAPMIALYFKNQINMGNPLSNRDIHQDVAQIQKAARRLPSVPRFMRLSLSQVLSGALLASLPLTMMVNGTKALDLSPLQYDKSWTNQSVNVVMDGDYRSYKEGLTIIHNGQEVDLNFNQSEVDFMINTSGFVSVYHEGELILKESIDNIDKISPIVSMTETDTSILLEFNDTDSGVNYDSISMSDQYGETVSYSVNDGEIVLNKANNFSLINIYVEDMAGNIQEAIIELSENIID